LKQLIAAYPRVLKQTNKQTKSQQINPDKMQIFGKQIAFCNFVLKILMKRANILKLKF